MIVFFGPAGAGKSVQGQLLSARNNWRWLSAGQLLRDTKDTELIAQMQTGMLVPIERTTKIMGDALEKAKQNSTINRVIIDGFPREIGQAKWLIESQPEHERSIALAIILEVPRHELLKRLEVRGRADDTPDAIEERLRIYRTEVYPILSYLTEQGVRVAHIDGTGTVGQVHDRITAELEACGLV